MLVNKQLNYKILSAGVFHAIRALEGIPEDLLDLFVPKSKEGLDQFEMNIVRWLSRLNEREKVIKLQKHYGLPLHPNQSLREVAIRIKILELKKLKGHKSDDSMPDEDNYEV